MKELLFKYNKYYLNINIIKYNVYILAINISNKFYSYLDNMAYSTPNIIRRLFVKVWGRMEYLERACSHLLYLPIRSNQSCSNTSCSDIYTHKKIHDCRSYVTTYILCQAESIKHSLLSNLDMSCKEGVNHDYQPTTPRLLIIDIYSMMTWPWDNINCEGDTGWIKISNSVVLSVNVSLIQ